MAILPRRDKKSHNVQTDEINCSTISGALFFRLNWYGTRMITCLGLNQWFASLTKMTTFLSRRTLLLRYYKQPPSFIGKSPPTICTWFHICRFQMESQGLGQPTWTQLRARMPLGMDSSTCTCYCCLNAKAMLFNVIFINGSVLSRDLNGRVLHRLWPRAVYCASVVACFRCYSFLPPSHQIFLGTLLFSVFDGKKKPHRCGYRQHESKNNIVWSGETSWG